MSADRVAGASVPTLLPGWFFPALAGWILVTAATLANATSIPVRADVVVALLGATAIGHGLVQRRWRVAGPLAALALGVAVALAVGALPGLALSDADGNAYAAGPADAVGVRVIWAAATTIGALVIAWGAWLHARYRAHLTESHSRELPAPDHDRRVEDIRARVAQVEERVGAIEHLLAPSVPHQ